MKKTCDKATKTILWMLPLLFIILAAAIIPLNLFLLPFPEWICILSSAGITFTLIFMWLKLQKHTMTKLLLSFFGVITIAFSLFGSYCNPYWNSISFRNNADWYCKNPDDALTYEQAKEDLDYAMKYLKKVHPKFRDGIPAEIQKQYDTAVSNFQQADTITVNAAAQQIQNICYLLGDAHTGIAVNYPEERYMKHIYKHKEAGDSLKGINGQTLEQLMEPDSPCSTKVSYEVKAYGVERLSKYITSYEGLSYLGIPVEDGVVYNYETENGETVDEYVTEKDFLPYDEYILFNEIEQSEDTGEDDFVSYEINETKNAAVLTLYSCTYNDEYKSTVRNMFREIQEKGIKNVAVDLRNNGGGNSLVANEFLKYIDVDSYQEVGCDWRLGPFLLHFPQSETKNGKYEDLLFDGNLYLFTSVYTFSSAMMFAEYVKDNHLGTIIGAAPGNAPDSYGDISAYKLPNLGVVMQVSTKKWYRIDNLKGLIEPDIPCEEWDAPDYFYRECQKH